MTYIYTAYDLELLTQKLGDVLGQQSNAVFETVYIVVDKNSEQTYLIDSLSSQLGMLANVKFITTKELLYLLNDVLSDVMECKSVQNSLQKRWTLFQLLGEDGFVQANSIPAKYYGEDAMKRMGLAQKMQELFDSYAIHQTQLLLEWKKGTPIADEEEAWQAALYRNYLQTIQEFNTDQVGMYEAISKLDLFEKAQLHQLLNRLYIYNLQQGNALFYNILRALDDVLEIHLFAVEPPDATKQMTEVIHLKNTYHTLISNTFQHAWQQRSLLGENVKKPIDAASISIQSCFTPTREVEVLYNYLVHTFANSPRPLGGRDVVVYCTNIKTYAPIISAVFDRAPVKLPYSISGFSGVGEDGVVEAVSHLFQLDLEWMKPEAIMTFLSLPMVHSKFEIDQLDLLRNLIEKANIRMAYTGMTENDTQLISWSHGLKRLILGAWTGVEDWMETADKTPIWTLDQTEGIGIAQLVKFNHFIEQLQEFLSALNTPKNMGAWVELFRNAIAIFFDESGVYAEELHRLKNKISSVLYALKRDALIDKHTFILMIHTELNSNSENLSHRQQGILFCDIAANKPVPKAVICILGINSNAFPRVVQPVGFDLLYKRAVFFGDSNYQDKQFFSDVLHLAKSNLFFSYLGTNVKTRAELPPSILIELMVEYYHRQGKDIPVVHHPLFGHSNLYNDADATLYNYLITKSNNAAALDKNETVQHKFNSKQWIPLDDFINFFKDSIKYYYNKNLNIYYTDISNALPGFQRGELDGFQTWLLKQHLIEKQFSGAIDTEKLRLELVQLGLLRLSNLGVMELRNINSEVVDMFADVQDLLVEPKRSIKIEYNAQVGTTSLRVVGEITSVYGANFIYFNTSKSLNKYKFEFLVQLYLLQQIDPEIKGYFVNNAGKATEVKHQLKDFMDVLVPLFINGQNQINPVLLQDKPLVFESHSSKFGYANPYFDNVISNGYFDQFQHQDLMKNNNDIVANLLKQFNHDN
ncbi:MAG: exodeoxyribonuclease V subunit gamma [Flavobacterium sp.]|nr:exodeoxyribonuclease V subunit gamma [Candidatus Neoflavobacterium equi]